MPIKVKSNLPARDILENENIIKDTYFKNHQFLSDTDTEVITELLSLFIKRYPPFDAIKRVMEIIKGSYAIIFMIKRYRLLFSFGYLCI